MNRELLQQALDAILAARDSELLHPKPFKNRYLDIIDKLESELAKPEQEPVAWMEDSIELYVSDHPTHTHTIPLYTAPPRKEWIWLTDEQLGEIRGRVQNHTSLDDPNYGKRVQYATLEWLNYPELTRKEWVGLTDDDIEFIKNFRNIAISHADFRAIEAQIKVKNYHDDNGGQWGIKAKLKEKNHGSV